MYEPLPILVEESLHIAWDYLEGTGDLGDPHVAGEILLNSVASMVKLGERRKLMLSNRAIADYKEYRTKRTG